MVRMMVGGVVEVDCSYCQLLPWLMPILVVSISLALQCCVSFYRTAKWISYGLLVLSHVWLFATLMYCSLPGSTVHGILQARILGWVAISSSRGSSWLRDQVHVSLMCLLHCRQILYHWATGETMVVYICQYCILNLSHFFPCYILSNFKKQLFCS